MNKNIIIVSVFGIALVQAAQYDVSDAIASQKTELYNAVRDGRDPLDNKTPNEEYPMWQLFHRNKTTFLIPNVDKYPEFADNQSQVIHIHNFATAFMPEKILSVIEHNATKERRFQNRGGIQPKGNIQPHVIVKVESKPSWFNSNIFKITSYTAKQNVPAGTDPIRIDQETVVGKPTVQDIRNKRITFGLAGIGLSGLGLFAACKYNVFPSLPFSSLFGK